MNTSRTKDTHLRRQSRLLFAAICCLASSPSIFAQTPAPAADEPAVKLDDLETVAGEDVNLIMPTQPIEGVLGLSKALVDTPRSVTVLSSDLIDSLSIRNSEDIARLVPSTYSNFRYGLQGNVNVRNVTSDFYFRGMRRIDPQGNWRTVFAANDSIEIVRGLPSPIFGLGRIGGYMNFNPKTARLGKTGKYLEKPTGNTSFTIGSFDKRIVTAEVGGPIQIGGKKGGYHVFGYMENSGSYYNNSPKIRQERDQQEIVQATLTLDITDKWRMETGGVSQYSRGGLPGGINRTTQELIDKGKYWNGGFSYKLDTNGDGYIGDTEILTSYYGDGVNRPGNYAPGSQQLGVTGTGNVNPSLRYIGQNNSPLFRNMPWQGGAVNGGTITMAQFNAGYTDLAGNARQGHQLMIYGSSLANGMPNTANAKVAFYMPRAFDLDPSSWQLVDVDYSKSFGEDFYEARVYTTFFDLVNDSNPDFTIKAQFLADYHDQVKLGRNPFSQHQEVFTAEEKITVTKKWAIPGDWLTATSFASANFHYYEGGRMTDNTADIDFRRSLMVGFTPNDTFSSILLDPTWNGSQKSVAEDSIQTTAGIGFATDFSFFELFDLFVGGRTDHVDANSYVPAGLFLRNGNGGISTASVVKGSDHDYSYSVSLTYRAPFGLRPYLSYADNASLLVNASTGAVAQANVRTNLLARTELKEAGIKSTLMKGRLFNTLSVYRQTRASFNPEDGDGGLSATLGEGIEFELRWIVNQKLSFLAGGNWSKNTYLPGSSRAVTASARFFGFPDVVDAAGNVLIPAEAFGYGGRLSSTISTEQANTIYNEVEGFPHRVLNLTATYSPVKNIDLRWTVYHQGSYSTDRLKQYNVPEATAHDAGITWSNEQWEVRLNVANVFDKLYFNKGAFYWVSARIPRSYELAVKRFF
ncbi:TonB-dependent receptor plug domain-containing protein [Nibricoccus aquaticus]|nr:TonB-dependent receptor plug domain-containing protein [Nibricoccus aquaticus]